MHGTFLNSHEQTIQEVSESYPVNTPVTKQYINLKKMHRMSQLFSNCKTYCLHAVVSMKMGKTEDL